jgi:ParB-like chromosome segregation protein Spo0J
MAEQLSLSAALRNLSTGFAEKMQPMINELLALPDHERLAAINEIRQVLHDICPMKHEPVDFVRWVASDDVRANEYNPNTVAPPEMKLLQLSIEADGYTQPIVAWKDGDQLEVIDGFHRNRVGKECKAVRERVLGYLPVVIANEERTDKGDRIAATIRHNRARGKHRVAGMSEIVVELKRRNWSDEKIGRDLGMDPDEVLRLCQCSGLASMFADKEFSEAWEAEAITEEDTLDVTLEDPSGVDASDL